MIKKGRILSGKGFTLAEMVVVLLIAGIFSVMLLPALANNRQQDRAADCMNNLRKIGQVVEMYKVDNDAWFPANFSYPYGHSGHDGWTWREAIWHYIEPGDEIPTPHGEFPLDTPGIYNCPSDRGAMGGGHTPSSYNMNNHQYRDAGERFFDGIGYNTGSSPYLAGAGKRPAGVFGSYWTLENWVEDPAGTILILDGRTPYFSWRYRGDIVYGPASLLPPESTRRGEISPQGPKHNGGYNFLFCDGSARWYKLEDTVGSGEYDLDNHRALGMWTKSRGD